MMWSIKHYGVYISPQSTYGTGLQMDMEQNFSFKLFATNKKLLKYLMTKKYNNICLYYKSNTKEFEK